VYSLGVFSTTVLVALTSQPSSAFTVKPPDGATGTYKPGPLKYTADSKNWTVELDPKLVTPATQKEKMDFKDFLDKSRFGTETDPNKKWTFTLGPELNGDFTILNYVACEPKTKCQSNLGEALMGGVGAYIDIKYNPMAGPKPGTDDDDPLYTDSIHWIQIYDASDLTPRMAIDVVPTNTTNPYYDDGATARMSEGLFADRPYRKPVVELTDAFTLFLVQQTAPRQVKIYSGVKWGFKNVPEPLTLIASGLALGFGALCQREYSKKRQQK
jgi:hypothetical protein